MTFLTVRPRSSRSPLAEVRHHPRALHGSPVTRWEVFRFLCDGLAPAFSPRRPEVPSASVPWASVIEAADDHLVTAALGWCLRGDDRVPSDVRACLETLLDLNGRRNRLMLQALEAAVASLNAAAIAPLLLKGAAGLAEDLYPDPGMRIMSDLDLLVREAQVDGAVAALEKAGFGVDTARQPVGPDHHHLPGRVHAEWRVGLELHTRPARRSLDALLDVAQCFRDARPLQWRGYQVLVPGPADWLVHNIAHGQIGDGHYWLGIPRLRQLLDLALLRARYAGAIDMATVGERFRKAGYGKVLADTVSLVVFLLEGGQLAAGSADDARAMARVRTTVERPAAQRWRLYRRYLFWNTRRLIDDPSLVLKVLRPSFWAREGIRNRARVTRW
jgi:putative nucleotidyltransferase-like protein